METKHTPTPWEVRHGASGWNVWHNGKLFAIAPTDTVANQIVRAVNSHAALAEALADLIEAQFDANPARANAKLEKARAALRLAKES